MQIYFSEAQRNKHWFRRRLKIYASSALCILAFLGIIYFIKEADFFKIKSIGVVGFGKADRGKFLADLELQLFKKSLESRFLGKENFFSWPSAIVLPGLQIASVSVSKNLFDHAITIQIVRRERLGIWCAEQNLDLDRDPIARCWWFDADRGLLFEEAPSSSGQLVFRVDDDDPDYPAFGKEILPQKFFGNFRDILTGLKILDLPVRRLTVNRSLEELTALTTNGSEFTFSLRFSPMASVVPAVAELLKQTPLAAISYMNLTVENKIYLKTR